MLTSRQLATVLAALRHWQEQLQRHGAELAARFPQFDDHSPLSVAEIDWLCDLLNESSEQTPETCDCESPGYFCSGVPGIVARIENGRLAASDTAERCDICQRFPTDAAALARLRELGIA